MYLVIFVLVFFLLVFVIPTYRVYRITGINPLVFSRTDTVHDYSGRVMKYLIAIVILRVFAGLWFDDVFRYTGRFIPEDFVLKNIAGYTLLHLSLLWVVIAVYQMGQSWRIGIDQAHYTDLKMNGVFRFSRNPVFLGIMLTMLGLTLLVPDAVMLAVLCGTMITLQVQVRLEEEFLTRKHGSRYVSYLSETRRWI